jgi:N6-L-threonylcarbamoyladenine synthase
MYPLLAIETSCDETAAAVIGPGAKVLANVIRSQIPEHRLYGGVVPEVASRRHVEWIGPVVDEALEQAGLTRSDLGSLAATRGPGLVGCLLVGLSYAQGTARALGVPVLGVNHMEGHLLAPFVGDPNPPFPFLALVVSGGHTLLIHARGLGEYELLGETRDDAAGEAFDKGARLLGLPYPGGIEVDRLSQEGRADAVALPRPMSRKPGLDFSFSGLKTALRLHVETTGVPEGSALNDVCASLQEAIVDSLLLKTRKAARTLGLKRVVVTGGVAANSRLRAVFAAAAEKEGWTLYRPDPGLCTDNAAMIGYAAALHLEAGSEPVEADVAPGLRLASRA